MHWANFLKLITRTLCGFILPSQFAMAVEVAFIEAYKDGHLIQLEQGGRFYHVAIRVGDRWLHAHPHKGVDLINELELYGHRFYYLHHDLIPSPTLEWAGLWLGKPFDRSYSWDHPSATYCTRLIADFLKVPPRRMNFAGRHWKIPDNVARGELKSRGQLGLSPDELYDELVQRGFTPVPRCEQFLEGVP